MLIEALLWVWGRHVRWTFFDVVCGHSVWAVRFTTLNTVLRISASLCICSNRTELTLEGRADKGSAFLHHRETENSFA